MELSHEKRSREKTYSNITDAAIVGSTSEESVLYASANREHLSVLDKLEEISKRKINPNYINQNINQQAGYSAEIKEQVHVNANNILEGKRERLHQYDDLSSEKKPQVKKLFPNYATPSKNHRKVNLWAEMVRSVLKNSYLKTMKNTWKIA
ncbi:hypothetical protein VN0170_08050 [Helicobacter pylori]